MNYRLEILKQLDLLEKFDLDRRAVERELGYSERYLDQTLSKGGSSKVYNRLLQLIDKCKLQFPTIKLDEPNEEFEYKLSKEEKKSNNYNNNGEDHSIVNEPMDHLLDELPDLAKGDDMAAMFQILVEHLQKIGKALKETRELVQINNASLNEMKDLTRENNSFARTTLLNQARDASDGWTPEAQKRFEKSLEVARSLLRSSGSIVLDKS